MWALTRSSFVLVFAVLGPVLALATMGDSRRRSRAELRRQRERYERDFEAALRAIDDAHDIERAALDRSLPAPAAVVGSVAQDPERWRSLSGEELLVRVGLGNVSSGVVLDEASAESVESPTESDRARRRRVPPLRALDELRHRAGFVERAPVSLDARWGIGVCGSRTEAAALATAIAVQLASALSPLDYDVDVAADDRGVFQWARGLPHRAGGSARGEPMREAAMSDPPRAGKGLRAGSAAQLFFRSPSNAAPVILSVADDEQSLPRDCRIVVAVAGSRASVTRHPQSQFPHPFIADYVSFRQAHHFARCLMDVARTAFPRFGDALPAKVMLRELLGREGSPPASGGIAREDAGAARERGHRDSLAATVGIGATGDVRVDLVSEGPHAIVGGTTGSGKSEVLVTWVLALAATYRPVEVNFLLVDFKGGAAFAPVQGLPHTVGVLTDLNPAAARRAILSLRAELQRRERVLAAAKARSLAELPREIELPRLLIVVDEFAAMTASFTEMHDLFADLAARGRSLGIHLILCTQRPAGTIRDAVLANCTLRVSLRVNNAADSAAVVGVPDAASIPQRVPGRAILLRGAEAETIQWAIAKNADATLIAERCSDGAAVAHRPWLDPLPDILEGSAVPAAPPPALAFGLADIPEEQRREPAVYNPVIDGNLFVIGGHGSGKSTLLATLKGSGIDGVTIPSNAEGAWDAVTEMLARVRSGEGPSLVLVDDVDLVMNRFSPDHESAFADRLLSLAREGPRAGTAIVFTAGALRGRVPAVSAQCGSTLMLRMRDRQEHVLAGGDAVDFSADLPPGAGHWRGHRVQVSFSDPLTAVTSATPAPLDDELFGDILAAGFAVISARPSAVRPRLERMGDVTAVEALASRHAHDGRVGELRIGRGSRSTIVLGEPDAWLSSPTLLSSIRERSAVVFHDCSVVEFRSLARTRELPPPQDSPHNTVIVVGPDGHLHRALLPSGA